MATHNQTVSTGRPGGLYLMRATTMSSDNSRAWSLTFSVTEPHQRCAAYQPRAPRPGGTPPWVPSPAARAPSGRQESFTRLWQGNGGARPRRPAQRGANRLGLITGLAGAGKARLTRTSNHGLRTFSRGLAPDRAPRWGAAGLIPPHQAGSSNVQSGPGATARPWARFTDGDVVGHVQASR